MIWSDCYGRWHFFFYIGAYECHESKRLQYLTCVCERREWETLKKTRREHLPQDVKPRNNLWKKVSSLDKDRFWYDLSNHYTFIIRLKNSRYPENVPFWIIAGREVVSHYVVGELLLLWCCSRVRGDVEEQHHVPLHVGCCCQDVRDLIEQLVSCLVVLGFKRFNSVFLRLVSNCGEELVCHRDRLLFTFCGKLRVCEGSCDLVIVDVKVGWFRGGEVRRLSLGEPLSDLVAVVCVVDDPRKKERKKVVTTTVKRRTTRSMY